jgi:Cu/Ag efflux protein CusF
VNSELKLISPPVASPVILLPPDAVTAPLRSIIPWRFLAALSLALVLWALPLRSTLMAQDEEHRKVPVIDKITSGGPSQQAFMGVVKSVDLESEVLDVDNITGKSTEIFPLKKKVHVVTADGDKLKLATLKPGTNVLVYFDQRGDHRTITRIVVLEGGPPKKKAPPS